MPSLLPASLDCAAGTRRLASAAGPQAATSSKRSARQKGALEPICMVNWRCFPCQPAMGRNTSHTVQTTELQENQLISVSQEPRAAPFQIQQNTGNQPRREIDWEADRQGRAGERRASEEGGQSVKQTNRAREENPKNRRRDSQITDWVGNKKKQRFEEEERSPHLKVEMEPINRIESRSSDPGRGRN